MNISNLSPLQQWLERINGYLTQENVLKARFASLLLPVFEAWELLSVLKKICFKSSRNPSESFSELTSKAHLLAVNIIFAGFEGFKDPLFTYQYHQTCGLAYLNKQKVTQSSKKLRSRDDGKRSEDKRSHRRTSSLPANETLKKLRGAPHILARHGDQDDILNRHYSLTARRKRPSSERPGLPSDWVEQYTESKLERKADSEWESLRVLTRGPMDRKGSYHAPRNGPVKFRPHASSNTMTLIDSSILSKLTAAIDSGFLKTLNFDETLHLHFNVKYILRQNGTFKGSSALASRVHITNSIQSILIARWVEDDYQKRLFDKYCLSLIKRMTDSIQPRSSVVNNEDRLFKKAFEGSLSTLFENWHEAQEPSIERKGTPQKTKITLDIHDHYEILKAYLQNLPTDLREQWKNLKEARTEAEWNTALTGLLPQDSRLIQALFMLLKVSYKNIWSDQLDDMLTAVTPLLTHICPNPAYLKRHII